MAHLLRRTTRFVQDNYTFKRAIVNKLPIAQHKDKMTRNFGGEHEVSNRRQGFPYLGAEQIVVRKDTTGFFGVEIEKQHKFAGAFAILMKHNVCHCRMLLPRHHVSMVIGRDHTTDQRQSDCVGCPDAWTCSDLQLTQAPVGCTPELSS
jgi:hypothetical protein